MSLIVDINDRNFGERLREPSQIMRVNSMSWAAIGGPQEASISVRGNEASLWEVAEWLRCPVKIQSDAGEDLWWGYIFKVRIRTEGVETVLSLGPMSNRVQADYTHIPSGEVNSRSAVTLWYSDPDSVSEYGTRERRFSFSQTSELAAINRLATALNEFKYPRPVFASTDAESSLSAVIECRGWWDMLNWKYFANNSGQEVYTSTGTGVQNVGTVASQQARQAFSTVTDTPSWYADRVYVRVRKTGTPTDTLVVAITDSGGAVLASGSIDPATLSGSLAWTGVVLDTTVTITAETVYYVRLSRSGANDNANYYAADVVEPPDYARGAFTYHNGTSWVTRDPDADMPFRVTGIQENTEQLKLLFTNAGQYFTGASIINPSGLYCNPYRDGSQLAKRIAEDLLYTGTTNSRRLLGRVLSNRMIEVYEEPADDSITYLIDANFRVLTQLGELVPPSRTPVGVWARMSQVIPASVNTTRLADASKVFIEGAQYDVTSNSVRLSLTGSRTLRDLGTVEQG